MTELSHGWEGPIDPEPLPSDAQEKEKICPTCEADLKTEDHRPGYPCYTRSDGPRPF